LKHIVLPFYALQPAIPHKEIIDNPICTAFIILYEMLTSRTLKPKKGAPGQIRLQILEDSKEEHVYLIQSGMPLGFITFQTLLNDLKIPFKYYNLIGLHKNKKQFTEDDNKFINCMGLEPGSALGLGLKAFLEDF
jgi:hypothetical protein